MEGLAAFEHCAQMPLATYKVPRGIRDGQPDVRESVPPTNKIANLVLRRWVKALQSKETLRSVWRGEYSDMRDQRLASVSRNDHPGCFVGLEGTAQAVEITVEQQLPHLLIEGCLPFDFFPVLGAQERDIELIPECSGKGDIAARLKWRKATHLVVRDH